MSPYDHAHLAVAVIFIDGIELACLAEINGAYKGLAITLSQVASFVLSFLG